MRSSIGLGVLALVTACASPARLAGRNVYLASAGGAIAVGQADAPADGGPLHLIPGSAAAGACLPPEEYDRSFGPSCSHEPEGATPAVEADVRWYCHGHLAVRVRLERCANRGRLRVAEIAVSTIEQPQ